MDIQKVKKEAEKAIDTVVEKGLTSVSSIETVDKLVDIVKDLGEIEKMEKHKYQGEYGEYENYGRNYMEGNYNEGNYNEGNYGRRGNYRGEYQEENYGRRMRDSRGRFKGYKMIDEMDRQYGNYSEGREQYGTAGKTMQALEYMLESVVDFVKMLKQDASSQKEVELIDKYVHKLQGM